MKRVAPRSVWDERLRSNEIDQSGDREALSIAQLPIGTGAFFLKDAKLGIRAKEHEPFEGMFRRFKRDCEKARTLADFRDREFFQKPSIRKKKKSLAARKRLLKQQSR